MKGHIAKKGARYYVVIEEVDPETRKRRRVWHSGFPTKRAAESALPRLLAEIDAGTYVAPSRLTLASFLVDDWLPAIAPSLRPGTVELYRTILRAYVEPHLGRHRLQAIRPRQLTALYAVLLERGGRGGRPLRPKTVRNVHVTLHRAFADAVRWGLIPRNPAELVRPPKRKSREMTALTADELGRFLDHVRGDRLYAAWVLAATTGLRRGELLGLRWKDLEASRLSIVRSLVLAGNRPTFSEPKTAAGVRSVPLAREATAALKDHRRRQAEERLALGPGYEDTGLIFCREDGRPLHPDTFSHAFGKAAEAAGVPRIRLHDVRHTFATLALRAGVHPKVVSEILGHASIAITLDTYSHAIPAMQEAAAATVAALIFPGRR